jgi:hypothetical protein
MNNKRLQVIVTDEASKILDACMEEANRGFEAGSISLSDMISEMILTAKVDIKALQLKHTDIRRALKCMAAKDDLELDSAIKMLQELKSSMGGRRAVRIAPKEAVHEQ